MFCFVVVLFLYIAAFHTTHIHHILLCIYIDTCYINDVLLSWTCYVRFFSPLNLENVGNVVKRSESVYTKLSIIIIIMYTCE